LKDILHQQTFVENQNADDYRFYWLHYICIVMKLMKRVLFARNAVVLCLVELVAVV